MSPDTVPLTIREIESARDPAWEGWKSIYYESFPENERMTEGYFLKVLKEKETGNAPGSRMLVLVPQEEPGNVLGIAYYDLEEEAQAGFLWYLATERAHRNQGYGALIYADILRRLKEDGATSLIFEVEKPELAQEEGQERGELAQRRIGWYQRQGARLLGGVQYFQSVDAPVAPTEMNVMAHPFVETTPEQVYEVASKLLGNSIERKGRLTLE